MCFVRVSLFFALSLFVCAVFELVYLMLKCSVWLRFAYLFTLERMGDWATGWDLV